MLLYQYLLNHGLLLHIMSQYLCLFSLILQGLHEEGECRQLRFWAGKGANIRDLFCTSPKVLKHHGSMFQNIKKCWAKEVPEGGHPPSTRVGARPTPLGAPPASWAPWWPSDAHLWLYGVFHRGKKSEASLRDETPPPRGGTLTEPI